MIQRPLTHLFSLSIETTSMPLKWKLANIHVIVYIQCQYIQCMYTCTCHIRHSMSCMYVIFQKRLIPRSTTHINAAYLFKDFGTNHSLICEEASHRSLWPQTIWVPLHSSTLHALISLHNFMTTELECDLTDDIMPISTDLT